MTNTKNNTSLQSTIEASGQEVKDRAAQRKPWKHAACSQLSQLFLLAQEWCSPRWTVLSSVTWAVKWLSDQSRTGLPLAMAYSGNAACGVVNCSNLFYYFPAFVTRIFPCFLYFFILTSSPVLAGSGLEVGWVWWHKQYILKKAGRSERLTCIL